MCGEIHYVKAEYWIMCAYCVKVETGRQLYPRQ